jgi:lipopolysaccharide/colanic/teichoic acid biosynthesis glycosyltransferase
MYEAKLKNELKRQKIKSHEKKIVTKQKTKQTQSENKNGFADAMKWVALSILGIVILVVIFLVIRAIKRHRLING